MTDKQTYLDPETRKDFEDIIAEKKEEFKRGGAATPSDALVNQLLDALMPACERISEVMHKRNALPNNRKYQHNTETMLIITRDLIIELIKAVKRDHITDKEAIPKIITTEEIGTDGGEHCTIENAAKLRARQSELLIIMEALGEQLGMGKQFATYYRQHSPLFTHPENVKTLATAQEHLH